MKNMKEKQQAKDLVNKKLTSLTNKIDQVSSQKKKKKKEYKIMEDERHSLESQVKDFTKLIEQKI